MRLFKEFIGRFVDHQNEITNETFYCDRKVTIDLLSIVVWNECDPGTTTIELASGNRFVLVIQYADFTKLIEKTNSLKYCQS